MANIIQGQLTASGERFAIVVARFNDLITERLASGAIDTITRLGGDENAIDIFKVPGAFEIPLAASRLAASGRYSAVICLGAVIQGLNFPSRIHQQPGCQWYHVCHAIVWNSSDVWSNHL